MPDLGTTAEFDSNKADLVMQKLSAMDVASSPTGRIARARRLAALRRNKEPSETSPAPAVQEQTIHAKINRYKGSMKK